MSTAKCCFASNELQVSPVYLDTLGYSQQQFILSPFVVDRMDGVTYCFSLKRCSDSLHFQSLEQIPERITFKSQNSI